MSKRSGRRTAQEEFWAGEFGTAYIGRNSSDELLAANLRFFALALRTVGAITSCLELGANIGINLKALGLLYPGLAAKAVEINAEAARALRELLGAENVREGSIFEYEATERFDLVLVKGLLIHLCPDRLPLAYQTIHRATGRFILLAEYYNPSPVTVPYRGHADRLFKRDFAGDLLEGYPDLSLRDYGFVYRRDPVFLHDDVNWFLLERKC